MKILKWQPLFVVEAKYLTEEGLKQKSFLKAKRIYLENKGVEFTRDKLNSHDAVCAVVYDEIIDKYIFVKQWRPGPEKFVIELSAGLLGDHDGNNDPYETMKSEVEQELGYKVNRAVYLCDPFYTTPGKTDEKMHLFFVTVSEQISDGGGLESENEDIEVIKVSKDEIKDLGIEDAKTLIGLFKMNLL